MDDAKKKTAIDALNRIMELELAGVVKYTHYALMVYGYNRIPIVSWLKGNADESLAHAHKAGELVTLLGGHPSLKIGPLLETEQHDIGDILRESLAHETTALAAYYDLLKIVEGASILLMIDTGAVHVRTPEGVEREAEICELELELESGRAQDLLDLLAALPAFPGLARLAPALLGRRTRDAGRGLAPGCAVGPVAE